MESEREDWIAPTGIRRIEPNATHTDIPTGRMEADDLSFTARGLYAELLSYQGTPMNPYQDARGESVEIEAAIAELIEHGYIVRVPRPIA
jgi:hypothetical protein